MYNRDFILNQWLCHPNSNKGLFIFFRTHHICRNVPMTDELLQHSERGLWTTLREKNLLFKNRCAALNVSHLLSSIFSTSPRSILSNAHIGAAAINHILARGAMEASPLLRGLAWNPSIISGGDAGWRERGRASLLLLKCPGATGGTCLLTAPLRLQTITC